MWVSFYSVINLTLKSFHHRTVFYPPYHSSRPSASTQWLVQLQIIYGKIIFPLKLQDAWLLFQVDCLYSNIFIAPISSTKWQELTIILVDNLQTKKNASKKHPLVRIWFLMPCCQQQHIVKDFIFLGFYPTAAFLILATYADCDQRALSVGYMVLVMVFLLINNVGFMVNHLDISPRFSGVLMGITNFAGTVAGCIAPSVTGYFTNDNVGKHLLFWCCFSFYIIFLHS